MTPSPAPRPLAVFDIDGVLADVRHRLHHLSRRPKDWDAFFAAAVDDAPLAVGIELAARLAADHDIVYLTGRPERCRADTEQWLRALGLPEGPLHMRRRGDHRPARMVKPQLLRRLADGAIVDVVVDDDDQVCAALEQRGFRVLRADWMADAPLLHTAQEIEGRT